MPLTSSRGTDIDPTNFGFENGHLPSRNSRHHELIVTGLGCGHYGRGATVDFGLFKTTWPRSNRVRQRLVIHRDGAQNTELIDLGLNVSRELVTRMTVADTYVCRSGRAIVGDRNLCFLDGSDPIDRGCDWISNQEYNS